jgi:hypothetical protein
VSDIHFRTISHLNIKFNPCVRFELTTGRTSSVMRLKAACFICEECNFCMCKDEHLLEKFGVSLVTKPVYFLFKWQ